MKYKLKMNKYDFYRVSDELNAKNITTEDGSILFETDEETKEKLLKSKYEVQVITTRKKKVIKKGKHTVKYVIALLFFACVIYINHYRVSGVQYNVESPINDEIDQKINSRIKRLFFFDFLNMNYETFGKQLREEYPMYPWITVTKKASKVKVNIYKYDDTYQQTGAETPGHIVAKKDAVIDAYTIFKGVGNLHLNQYVKKGDILVSGMIKPEDETSVVSAKANIMAYTHETYQIKVDKKTTETIKTGKKEQYYQVGLFSLDYNFNYKGLYSQTDTVKNQVFNLFNFLSFKKIEDYEKYDIIKTYSKDEAIEFAKTTIVANFENCKTTENEDILNVECIGVTEDETSYTVQVLTRKYESIGEFIKIS